MDLLMTRFPFFLAMSCSDFSTHVPNITAPCSRAAVAEVISQPDECVRLDDAGGALFRLTTSEDCGGPACIRYCDGAAAFVLEKLRPGPAAEWTERRGTPDEVPFCAHSALCEEQPERCE
jgi:hypothetical protein